MRFSRDLVQLGLEQIARFTVRRPYLVLGALLTSFAIATAIALQLEVRASFVELLPEDARPVRELREVITHARVTSDVVIAIPARDRERAIELARALVERLRARPEISTTGGHLDTRWFRERRLLFVPEDELARIVEEVEVAIDEEVLRRTGFDILGPDEEEQEAGSTAGGSEDSSRRGLLAELERIDEHLPVQDWTFTRDGEWLVLWAFFRTPSAELEQARANWAAVRETVDSLLDGERFPRDLDVRYTGGIPTRVEEDRALVGDLQIAGAVGLVAVLLLIVAALRAPRALVLVGLPLLIGLVWTFAFARLAIGHLNIISGFLFSILSGLGIEYGIHMLHAFRERRERGEELGSAVSELVATTGRALVSGSLTNASVFAVISMAQFRGFSEFGIIAAVGLLLTLVSTVLGLPALLVISERLRPMRLPPRSEIRDGVHVPSPLRWTILIGVPLIAAISAVVIARGEVAFDSNWRVLTGESEVTRFGQYLESELSGTFYAGTIWVPDRADAPRVEQIIDELGVTRRARGERFEVAEVQTAADFVPPQGAQLERAELARALGRQLARLRDGWVEGEDARRLAQAREVIASTVPFTRDDLPESVQGWYQTSDGLGTMAYVAVPGDAHRNTAALLEWAEQARAIVGALDAAEVRAPMLSENWIAGEVFERIIGDGRWVLGGTLIAVFLVLLLDLRRPLASLAVLGSVLLGVAAMGGGMWLTGVRLNFMNAAILPVCIGISLDNAIHVFHRWREEGPGSVPIVLRHTSVANALSSATNLLGFGALVITHHAGLRSVAHLAALGVALTYLSTTLWFPMLLETIDRFASRSRR